jgi:hypothetical protein
LKDLGAVHETLASHGVGSVETGFDMTGLAAAVYARGWSYSIDRTGADFRATVAQPSGERDQFRAVGIGWSLEVALAFALAKAFTIVHGLEQPTAC